MRWYNVHIFPFSPTRSVVYSSSLNLSLGLVSSYRGPPGPRQRSLPGVSHSSGGQPWHATASPVVLIRHHHEGPPILRAPEQPWRGFFINCISSVSPSTWSYFPSFHRHCLESTTPHSLNAQISTSRPTSWETPTRSGFFMITCCCYTQSVPAPPATSNLKYVGFLA